jgi:N-acetylmuramic acid 6-phosphate (MurNAc-6-P) etherase
LSTYRRVHPHECRNCATHHVNIAVHIVDDPLGPRFQGLMVDVLATNRKLVKRKQAMLSYLTGSVKLQWPMHLHAPTAM